MKFRYIFAFLLAGAFLFLFSSSASAETVVCKVAGKDYSSLTQAVKDVMSGAVSGEIVMLTDAELDVGTISAPVSISGGGYKVTFPAQSGTEDGRLDVHSTLSFSDTEVFFANPKTWSVVLGGSGVISLSGGSSCAFEKTGVYSLAGGEIRLDASQLTMKNMEYTAMMAEAYGKLSLKNGSVFAVSHLMDINGITGFDIGVDNSRFSVTECRKQGLVKCSLSLTNGAAADISRNGIGYNMYSKNIADIGGNSTLTMDGNGSMALLIQGSGSFTVRSDGHFFCRNNGLALSGSDLAAPENAAVNIGYFSSGRIYKNGGFTVYDNAEAVISGNHSRGIVNCGTAALGRGTLVAGNGIPAEKGGEDAGVPTGGGIYNLNNLSVSEGAYINNNHALVSADDICNADGASVVLAHTGGQFRLDPGMGGNNCGDSISGWYEDNEGQRWNAHGENIFTVPVSPAEYSVPLALKAAHGVIPKTGDEAPLLFGALLLSSVALLALVYTTFKLRRSK